MSNTGKHKFRWGHWLALATLFIVAIYDLGELTKEIREHEAVGSASMFAIPSDLSDYYSSCNYHLLFFCDKSSAQATIAPGCDQGTSLDRAACNLTDNGKAATTQVNNNFAWRSVPLVGLVVSAVVTLPRIPGAVINMLETRWKQGSLQVTLGLLFTFGWITLLVLALRQKAPENLLWFAFVVVLGPYLLMGAFWLLQHIFDKTESGVSAAAAYIVSVIGLPGCVLMCSAHDAKEIAEVFKAGEKVSRL